ncbi:hypothetical protein BDP27DRAFT_1339297 [Rhodocollybia butyracea]|uniref:Uncharacterized protein n=1 Tax=Rhodocollybia butyracea TaxID=206335 RepID=A0A9P5TYM2_9AGAR|nr:hypothetical protein BDP27DRAFT_1339297 [Rhodocollybia butyracea]
MSSESPVKTVNLITINASSSSLFGSIKTITCSLDMGSEEVLKQLPLTAEDKVDIVVYLVPTISVFDNPGIPSQKAESILTHWCSALVEMLMKPDRTVVPPTSDTPGGRPYVWLNTTPLHDLMDYVDITQTGVHCIIVPRSCQPKRAYPHEWLVDMPLSKRQKTGEIIPSSTSNDTAIADADIRQRVVERADALLVSIRAVIKDADLYNPYATTSIPVPSIQPSISFQTTDDPVALYKYRGRKTLEKEILSTMRMSFVGGRSERIGFFGTKGAGRSHLATTAASVLLSESIPVVFLAFSNNQPATSVIRDAFLLALRSQQKLYCHTDYLFDCCCDHPDSLRGLIKFAKRLRCKSIRLLFVVLALDHLSKSHLEEFYRMTEGHVLCFTANANSKLRRENEQRLGGYSGRKPLYLNGGLSEDDLEGWWSQFQADAGILISDKDRELIETTTGNVPLLLTSVFSAIKAAGSFQKEDLRIDLKIYEDMDAHVEILMKKSPAQASNIRSVLQATLNNTHLDVIPYLCADRRYVYQDNVGRWRCANLYVYEAVYRLSITVGDSMRFFRVQEWLNCIPLLAHNPSMLGYAVEYAVTNELGRQGLDIPSLQLTFPKSLPLHPLPSGGIPETIHESGLYVPMKFNHRYIDCVAIWFKSSMIYIYPIQISNVAKISQHSDSEKNFFSEDWKLWHKAVARKGWEIRWKFVWIINCPQAAISKTSRRKIKPPRTVHTISIKIVNADIASGLDG